MLSGPTVYCPLCSTEREKPEPQTPWGRMVLVSFATLLAVGAGLGVWFSWQVGAYTGLFAAVLCFLGLEVYYGVKFRDEMKCPVCHFNPLLFRRSPEAAKKQCLERLKQKESTFFAKWRALKQQRLGENP